MPRSDGGTVVLVEGLSDAFAIEAAAARCGRDLRSTGVEVLPMGGATNIGRYLARYGPAGRGARITALCDVGEEPLFARSFARAGLAADYAVCHRDLEDELIRALGAANVEAIIEREGELASLRRLQQMPFHRNRRTEEQLHRFLGARSGRKYRYAPRFVEALDADALPRPLLLILAFAGAPAGS